MPVGKTKPTWPRRTRTPRGARPTCRDEIAAAGPGFGPGYDTEGDPLRGREKPGLALVQGPLPPQPLDDVPVVVRRPAPRRQQPPRRDPGVGAEATAAVVEVLHHQHVRP